VPDEVGEHLLATLREALSNVARHAKASSVDVRVTVDHSGLHVTVLDNGIGIEEGAASTGGRGVTNMAQRATSVGGDLRIEARPEGGTVVQWQVPLGG
jgi:signal transduction histidine kinase